ncbi:hypothetical protein QF017_001110 [Pseudomonas laurylsulfatiphila]
MEPLPDGGGLVFMAGARAVNRVIVHRWQASSHRLSGIHIFCVRLGHCGSWLASDGVGPFNTLSKTHHNPDFNRLNARINARLNALPLSFLLYSEALTAAVGYVPGSLRIAGSIKPSAAVIALA